MSGIARFVTLVSVAAAAAMGAAESSEARNRLNLYFSPYYEPGYPIYLEEPVFVPRRRQYYYQPAPRAYYEPAPRAYYQPPPRGYYEAEPQDYAAYGYDEQYYEPRYEEPAPAPRKAVRPAESQPPAAKPATKKAPATISCSKATKVVSGFGFGEIKTVDCKGQIYAFNATRDGKKFAIKLNAVNGELTEVKKL